jgi:hypothetical protein
LVCRSRNRLLYTNHSGDHLSSHQSCYRCWRKTLGPIPMLVFVRWLTLVSIGPTRPSRLGETLYLVFLLLFVVLQIYEWKSVGKSSLLEISRKIRFNFKKRIFSSPMVCPWTYHNYINPKTLLCRSSHQTTVAEYYGLQCRLLLNSANRSLLS